MRLTHDGYYLQMLSLVAARSTCVRRSVGAIIVDQHHVVLSTGYNGVPSGFDHCIDHPCSGAMDASGDTRRCMAIHAEANALLQCNRLDLARKLYVSCVPCFECAKMICNTPIKEIVCLEDYPGIGAKILVQSGVKILVAKS